MITLKDFIGNEDLIRLLRISVSAAKAQNNALPHLLLKGPAGTGKTTLAEAVAREFGVEPIAMTPGTARKNEDLRKVFLRMPGEGYDQRGQIVGAIRPQIIFIDEIHQLPLPAQENLGIAMQDWKLPVKVNGADAFEWVPRFTLVGATTLPGKLSKPFLDRFKIQEDFETYSLEECEQIVRIHAEKRGLILESGVSEAIAKRARGVARLIVRFLDRLSDAAVVSAQGTKDSSKITLGLAQIMFSQFLKVDDRGLTKSDVKILLHLVKAQEPLGVDALAVATNEDKSNVERTIEPFLVQQGLLARTKRGRIITEEGRRYLLSSGYLKDTAHVRSERLVGG